MKPNNVFAWLVTIVLAIVYSAPPIRSFILNGISAITTIVFVIIGTYFAFNLGRKSAVTAVAGIALYISSWIVGYVWGVGTHATLAEVIRDSASWTSTEYWSTVAAQAICVTGILVWFLGCGKAFINTWWGPHTKPAV